MRNRVLTAAPFLVLLSTSSLQAQTTSPPLALSERVGGEGLRSVVSDGNGGVWATGTMGPGLATFADSLQPASGGGWDAAVLHIGADGRLLYATYLGGTYSDHGQGIARDSAGNVYVVGSTTSTDFPTTPGAIRPTAPGGGGLNAFVVKLDPTGRHAVYSTYLGGNAGDEAVGVAVDAAGSAAVVGMTQGWSFPYTWSRCLDYSNSQNSSFYTRLSPDGASIRFSGCLDDSTAAGVTLDANGDAFVVGTAGRQFGPRMGRYIGTFPQNASSQGFLAKFAIGDANPLPFSMYIGGDGSDAASAVAVSSKGVYVAGEGYSVNYPGAPTRHPQPKTATLEDGRTVEIPDGTAWMTKVSLDGNLVLGTTLIDGDGSDDRALALQVDSAEVVHVTGDTDSTDLPTSADAPQRTFAGRVDAWYAQAWMPNNVTGDPSFLTYLGGSTIDRGHALVLDGSDGVWIGGETDSADFPDVRAKTTSGPRGFVARYGQPIAPPAGGGSDVVLYAKDASAIAGSWQPVADSTAAGGTRLWNPDAGMAKLSTAAASPASYFELAFHAEAGVPYHLWLRMKADNDAWQNDSAFVQFSDTVDAGGTPIWRIGTTSATFVSLEDCSGCGEHGWGWNDNGYGAAGQPVTFATTGVHTIRIQQREDGISIDQIVLSATWANPAPGANKDDATILETTTPPPSQDEVVIYAGEADAPHGGWQMASDTTAAGGSRLWNPDAGAAKLATAATAPANYFDVTFDAKAGVAYHLWLRMKADADSWQNDSVFVQFSDSVDGSGNPRWQIGSTSATMVSLEDCSGCGEQGWGWNDNGYGAPGPLVVFAAGGRHTIRVQQREDGISIDQIVLSSARYLDAAPGAARNDTTIVPK